MEIESVEAAAATPSAAVELGIWIGRHQAWALVASRCSAADAYSLRVIREQKLYREMGLTWQEFCKQHAGCSSRTADRVISKLEEFGESYFHLSQIVNVPAAEYRALQPAIEDNALEFDGRRIEINRENTEQLIEAVRTLRGRLEKPAPQPSDAFTLLQNHLDRAVGELSGAARRVEEGLQKDMLLMMIDDHITRAYDVAKKLGVVVKCLPEEQTE